MIDECADTDFSNHFKKARFIAELQTCREISRRIQLVLTQILPYRESTINCIRLTDSRKLCDCVSYLSIARF